MPRLSRRELLRNAAALSLGFTGLNRFVFALEAGQDSALDPDALFGPLQADPLGVIDLPAGFSYHVISKYGERMDDGLFVPALHDGMAAFPGPNGLTILMRNHEVTDLSPRKGPFGWNNELLDRIDPDRLYDPGAPGANRPLPAGVTTLVYDTRARRLVRHFLSLAGTKYNCAGGPTPWGTWITCEETEQLADDEHAKDHGWAFEVPARADGGLADPRPLKGLGRFKHEAVALDPASGILYLTEDIGDGLIYRFIPQRPGDMAGPGRLQALSIRDRPSADTRNWSETPTVAQGDVLEVQWIDLEEIDSPKSDLRHRGHAAGAALFARGEGMWWGRNSIYFAATEGGPIRAGQIWRYVPSRHEGTADEDRFPGRLELFVESRNVEFLNNCDNLTVAPWGDLIVAEDCAGQDRLIGITAEGRSYLLGRNVLNNSEMAGPTFSPDGTTLFFNMQHPGLTLAVTGPWPGRGG